MDTRILHAAMFTPGPNHLWGLPMRLIGGPGTAKSDIITQVATEAGLHVQVVIASLRDPTDFLGLPIPSKDGSVRYAPPDWAKQAAEAKHALVFLDEISCTAPATQAALLRVVLDRVVGEFHLPETVRILAAQNSVDEAAGGYDLAMPLANRFGTLADWQAPDARAWSSWLLGAGNGDDVHPTTNPVAEQERVMAAWPLQYAKASGVISTFITCHPSLLHAQPPAGSPQASLPWPSRRCYDDQTEVLTARGFVAWPEVRTTDTFATLDPEGVVTYVHAAEIVAAPYRGKMLRIEAEHLDLLTTPDHSMYVAPDRIGGDPLSTRNKNREQFGLVPGDQLLRELTSHPTWAVRFRSDATWKSGGVKTHVIGDKTVDMDTWAEFAGWWLTDGCTWLGNQGKNPRVSITQVDKKKRSRVLQLMSAVASRPTREGRDRVATCDPHLFAQLAPLGRKHDGVRRVPREILDGGPSAWRALLNGATGGDGWTKEDGRQHICVGVSKGLAADLQEAALRLGGAARVTQRKVKSGKTVYTVHLLGRRYARPRISASHMTMEEYDGMVYCSRVEPHHTLLVRRNGHAVWSGNTWAMATRAMAASVIHRLDEPETDRYVGAFVGGAAMTELRSFLANLDLPDPAALLDGKVTFAHDKDRLDRSMAVFSSCAALVAPKTAEKREDRGAALWALLNQNMGTPDVIYPAVRALCNRDALLVRIGGKLNQDAESVLARFRPIFQAAGLMQGA